MSPPTDADLLTQNRILVEESKRQAMDSLSKRKEAMDQLSVSSVSQSQSRASKKFLNSKTVRFADTTSLEAKAQLAN